MRPSKLNLEERQNELYADNRNYDGEEMCPAKDDEGRDLVGRPMYSVEQNLERRQDPSFVHRTTEPDVVDEVPDDRAPDFKSFNRDGPNISLRDDCGPMLDAHALPRFDGTGMNTGNVHTANLNSPTRLGGEINEKQYDDMKYQTPSASARESREQ